MAKAKDTSETLPAVVADNAVMSEADILKALATRSDDGPTGFEGDDASDRVLPFYNILQGLSPQMRTVDGAKLGSVINTATNELFHAGINIVPVRKDYKFMEWKPNQGGIVGAHAPDSEVVAKARAAAGGDQFAKLKTDAGNDLVETKYVTGVVCDDTLTPLGFGVVAFKSTSLKVYKRWNEAAASKSNVWKTKLWELVWHLGVVTERNEKGEFYNWNPAVFGGRLETAFVRPGSKLALAIKELQGESFKIDHANEGGATAGNAAGNNDSAM